MTVVSHIVLPLDGSRRSERAIPYARALADEHSSRLVIVSVIEAPTEFTTWAATPAAPGLADVDTWIRVREEYLGDVRDEFGRHAVETQVSIGSPAPAILDISDGLDDAVIVMASHGRTGLVRAVLGSVAARVIQRATCPVLIVPAHDDEPGAPPGFEHVLVPLDGSETAQRALNVALDTLRLSGRSVHLIRVIESPDVTAPTLEAQPEIAVDYEVVVQYQNAARVEAEDYLGRLAGKLNSRGITTTWEVTDGDVADEIRRSARERGVNLIAMATRGRTGLDRWALGSVASDLVSEIHRPVLLVGPRESE